MEKLSVCIIGSGKYATNIAKIVAENAARLENIEDRVNMFVYEETYEEENLSTLINTQHKNPKYAPEIKLPENLVAVTDLRETARNADVIIFILPHYLLPDFSRALFGVIKSSTLAVSLTNSFMADEEGGLQLPSRTIMQYLKIPCAALVGTNLATALALDSYCEATLGCRDTAHAALLVSIFKNDKFRVTPVFDVDCVEVFGYIKHILSFASGILDGFNCNFNTKSACIRFGVLEIIRFIDIFYPFSKLSTLFKSCGLSDIMTACAGSRSRRLAEAFVKKDFPLDRLELEMFNGEKILGPVVANSVSFMIQQKGLTKKFPLFTAINDICNYNKDPEELIDCLRTMSGIIYHPVQTFPF